MLFVSHAMNKYTLELKENDATVFSQEVHLPPKIVRAQDYSAIIEYLHTAVSTQKYSSGVYLFLTYSDKHRAKI